MKEVLIYGALVAAVLGISSNLISRMIDGLPDKAGQINAKIDERIDTLINLGS